MLYTRQGPAAARDRVANCFDVCVALSCSKHFSELVTGRPGFTDASSLRRSIALSVHAKVCRMGISLAPVRL